MERLSAKLIGEAGVYCLWHLSSIVLDRPAGQVACKDGVLRGFRMENLDPDYQYTFECCSKKDTCSQEPTFDTQYGEWMPLAYSNSNFQIDYEVGWSTSSSL